MQVCGWILVHTNGDQGAATFDNDGAPAGVRMGDPVATVREVAEWLVDGYHGFDRSWIFNRVLGYRR
ncbi:hypothetical protein [Cellulomonas hominis]